MSQLDQARVKEGRPLSSNRARRFACGVVSGERTILGRIYLGLTCAMALSLGQFDASAQSGSQRMAVSEDWTVLTMHGDAWGVATEHPIGGAIARAITNCKAISTPTGPF